MSTPQPIEEQDRASLDGLDGVFSTETETEIKQPSEQEENQEEIQDKQEPGTALSPPEADEESEDESDTSSFVGATDKVSRSDLISLLEGFVGILKRDGDINGGAALNVLRGSQAEELKFTDVDIEDKTAELEDMRRLVIEAQETIIKLLTDRVEDRARIAGLETELKLLPDLQEQADRAMAVAFKTEEFRSELHKVKYELERNRIASVRKDMYKGPRGMMTRVRHWFIKAQGLSIRNFEDAVRSDSKVDSVKK